MDLALHHIFFYDIHNSKRQAQDDFCSADAKNKFPFIRFIATLLYLSYSKVAKRTCKRSLGYNFPGAESECVFFAFHGNVCRQTAQMLREVYTKIWKR